MYSVLLPNIRPMPFDIVPNPPSSTVRCSSYTHCCSTQWLHWVPVKICYISHFEIWWVIKFENLLEILLIHYIEYIPIFDVISNFENAVWWSMMQQACQSEKLSLTKQHATCCMFQHFIGNAPTFSHFVFFSSNTPSLWPWTGNTTPYPLWGRSSCPEAFVVRYRPK